MRVCPRCQGRYDDDTRFCPRDGAALSGDPADPLLGSVLLGQFELREVQGRGAMGTVYRALQRGTEREVAVKVLRDDFVKDPAVVKRFHREARSVARLDHPNIVKLFLVGETAQHVPFMVMELVAGEPLSLTVARGDKLPPARALHIARQIASALVEAHAAGVIHRDLKPANILVDQRRRTDVVKVVDFGIAKIIGDGGGPAPGESALTRTGTIFGTPHYLSPEQGQGTPVDGRADLYSLGVILFALLTGRVPFDGSGMAVVVQHVSATPPRPSQLVPGLSPGIERLVLDLLAKEPGGRPASAEILVARIDGLLAALGEPAPRAESQPFVPDAQPARHVLPALTVQASSLAPPPVSPPHAATLQASALRGALPPPASHAVTLMAGQLRSLPGAAPLPAPPLSADATLPPGLPFAPLPAVSGVLHNPAPVPAETLDPPGSSLAVPGSSRWRSVVLLLVTLAVIGGAAAATLAVTGKRVRPLVTLPADAAPVTATPAPAPSEPVLPYDPVTAGALAEARVITLGEAGWAVRVLVPDKLDPGQEVALAVEIWDPEGVALAARELRLTIEEPSGVVRSLHATPTATPGRYALRRRFAAAGTYRVSVFPAAGKSRPTVWFDLPVGPPPAAPAAKPVPRPAPKAAPPRRKVAPPPAELEDPYRMLDEEAKPPAPREPEPPKPKKPSTPAADGTELLE